MKKSIFFAIFILFAGVNLLAQDKTTEPKVQHLTYKEFIDKIWDLEKSPKEFIFKGETPAIVDFYADWCGPCRKVGPIMEKLAKDYDGRLSVYKINVDKEKELSAIFQVRSIPTVIFIPMQGQPMMQVGAMSESEYRKVVDERLLK
ncbi:MAG: thioredoxin [Bacteroidales bacterium]|nr:thioredoxin [Bacteroidales bacterium]